MPLFAVILRRTLAVIFLIVLLLPLTISIDVNSFGFQPQQPSQTMQTSTPTYAKVPYQTPQFLSKSRPGGLLQPSTIMTISAVLPPRNSYSLSNFLSTLYNPFSPDYHHFLTPSQFSQLYSPDPSETSQLISYFSSKGLYASVESSNPYIIRATGPSSSVSKAFNIQMQTYEYQGSSFYSPAGAPQLPSKFSNIQMVYGLDSYSSSNIPKALPFYRTLGPVPAVPTSGNFVYYSPSEIKQMYNLSSLANQGFDGSGISIAIVDAYGDPYIQQELDNFSGTFHLPSTTVNVICVDGPCTYSEGITQGWNTEIALDVEWAHSLAPGARINLYIGSNSSQPLFDAVVKAVQDGTNSIISMSWGSPENSFGETSAFNTIVGASYPWLDQVFQQAAAEGITAFSSTGDWGAYDQGLGETSPYGGTNYPSTDPFVTAVGGTSLYMNTSSGYIQYPFSNATGSYGSETAWSWNNAYGWATGGGYSTFFNRPSWQNGLGILDSMSSRGVPDVSWVADVQTGVIVGTYNQTSGSDIFQVVGGTSVGSPSWSGALAVILQKKGHNLGTINPEIYSILQNSQLYGKAFHDVTVGNSNPLSAGPGWDPTTGVGSPNIGELSDILGGNGVGGIAVSVNNSLSGQYTKAYPYGSAITINAKLSGASAGAIVYTNITSQTGSVIANNLQMIYNSSTGLYTASHRITSSDPAGQWSADVLARSGTLYGIGYTSFSVGGGITIFEPFFNTNNLTPNSHFVQIGNTLQITAQMTNPDGSCCVTSGSYGAHFYYNAPGGKQEGYVALRYSSGLWQGNFTIPNGADQGSWSMVVNGTDSEDNLASANEWMYVGLSTAVTTDSPNYLLGDPVFIAATPTYSDGTKDIFGSYTATISIGSRTISIVPLSYNPLFGEWIGTYFTKSSDPSGYYNITVTGSDKQGNFGVGETIVRVGQYHLSLDASLASPSISVVNGSEDFVSAKLTYPNGTTVKSASVEAYVSLDFGGAATLPLRDIRMTYQANSNSFVGIDVLSSKNISDQSVGRYDVVIQAFDTYGNYANTTTSFFINGLPHSPISIASNSEFTPSNGVINGTGFPGDPYVFQGWNTTSISISGSAVNASYAFINDWVSGGTSNGISIDTPSSSGPILYFVFSSANHGTGISIANTQSASLNLVASFNNTGNGISLINDSRASQGSIFQTIASFNDGNGIFVNESADAQVAGSFAVANKGSGILVENSPNALITLNYADNSPTGIEVTGTQNYQGTTISGNNVLNDGVGIFIDGMNQVIAQGGIFNSLAFVSSNVEANDSIGISAKNHAFIRAENNTIGLGGQGIVVDNSLPLIISNLIVQESAVAISVSGVGAGVQQCKVVLNNTNTQVVQILNYSSCIAQNEVDYGSSSSSAIVVSNQNDSFVSLNNVTNVLGGGVLLKNVSNSAILANLLVNNSKYGILLQDSQKNNVSFNAAGLQDNGFDVNGGANNVLGQNNASLNYFNGILLNDTSKNLVVNNSLVSNAGKCSGACTLGAGIDVLDSSMNNITQNSIRNSTASPPSLGVGILFDTGSRLNSAYNNTVTQSDVGIGFAHSNDNNATLNSLSHDKYGIFLLDGARNSYLDNIQSGNQQDVYPNNPSIAFSSPNNKSTVYGAVPVQWNITGQGISDITININGTSYHVLPSAKSFLWNTSSLGDGGYLITLNVTNSGGISAASNITVFTDNVARRQHSITAQVITPTGAPLQNVNVTLSNTTASLNLSTNSSGEAQFQALKSGNYRLSVVVNGTDYSVNATLGSNATTAMINVQHVVTTFAANSSKGNVQITLSGNVISSQISNASFTTLDGQYALLFTIQGSNGTAGSFTITIPKNSTQIPSGAAPVAYIDGTRSDSFTFSQDSANWYISINMHFSAHHVTIRFEPANSALQIGIVIFGIVAVTVALIVLFLFKRRRRGSASERYSLTPNARHSTGMSSSMESADGYSLLR